MTFSSVNIGVTEIGQFMGPLERPRSGSLSEPDGFGTGLSALDKGPGRQSKDNIATTTMSSRLTSPWPLAQAPALSVRRYFPVPSCRRLDAAGRRCAPNRDVAAVIGERIAFCENDALRLPARLNQHAHSMRTPRVSDRVASHSV